MPKDPSEVFRFFVIGDYGDVSKYRILSSVTDTMNNLASEHSFSHIVTVGDNIYENGLEDISNRWKPWIVLSLFK